MIRLHPLAAIALLVVSAPAVHASDAPLTVPRAEGVSVDGDLTDWGENGLGLGPLVAADGHAPAPDDLSASARVAWDDKGLLLAVTLRDDRADEAPIRDRLAEGDAVGIRLETEDAGAYRVWVAPGVAPDQPEARMRLVDRRPHGGDLGALQAEIARTVRAEGGTRLEARLPWSNIGVTASPGTKLGLTVTVRDRDGGSGWTQVGRPAGGSAAVTAKLATEGPEPLRLAAGAGYDRALRHGIVGVTGTDEAVGERVTLVADGEVVGEAALTATSGRPRATFHVPVPEPGEKTRRMAVRGPDGASVPVHLPDADRARARRLAELAPAARRYVFSGAAFPALRFERPRFVEALAGEYEVEARFYDHRGDPVERAASTGRYGAVATVRTAHSGPFKRFVPLFRQADPVNMRRFDARATLELPKGLGVSPDVVFAQTPTLSRFVTHLLARSFRRDPASARVLAGLFETPPDAGEAAFHDDVAAKDRQFWVELKRRLYELRDRWPAGIESPGKAFGETGPALRPGQPREADLASGLPDRLDQLGRSWAQKGEAGLALAVARRGKLVVNRAYGEIDGRPARPTRPVRAGTLGRVLVAVWLAQAHAADRVELHEPLGRLLPPFADVPEPARWTLARLGTHTSGLARVGIDPSRRDLAERIAVLAPHLDPGTRLRESEAGFGLLVAALELATGEAMPKALHDRLLEPLGCLGTRLAGPSALHTTVEDLARIGQLLANGGSYGEKRFFDAAALEAIAPRRLVKPLGEGTRVTAGVALDPIDAPGWSDAAFGHVADNGSLLAVDPEAGLVVAVTRGRAGAGYDAFREKLLAAVAEAKRPAGP